MKNNFLTPVALAGLALAGCDISVTPKKPDSSTPAVSPERDADLERVNSDLVELQAETAKVDALLSAQIGTLRDKISTKINKEDARAIIEQEMEPIRARVKELDLKIDFVNDRLDTIVERLGILNRVPEAPWYKEGQPAKK